MEGTRIGSALTVLVLSVLIITACKDDPAGPNPDDETGASVHLTAPAAGTVILRASSVRLDWEVREGAVPPDSVRLQYHLLDGNHPWQVIAKVPFSPSFRNFRLPDSLQGRFELRIQGTEDTEWDVVSPLLAASVVIRLVEPVKELFVFAQSEMQVRWELDLPEFPAGSSPIDSGEVEIQYALLGASLQWQTVARVPASPNRYLWRMPQSIDGDFALRARSTAGSEWSVVSPLHLQHHDVKFTAPAAGSKYRVGKKVHIGWSSGTAVNGSDRVFLEYREGGGAWQGIGSFAYSTLGTDWTPPASKGRKYALRIRHEDTPTWTQLDEVYTADIRIRDITAGTVLARGTPLSVRIDVDLPWTSSTAFTLDMTTNNGATWSPALEGWTGVFDHPASQSCRFRAWRDDLPFADTSATFSVVDNLVDYPVLVVGQHYVYEYVELVWEQIFGGIHVTPRGHPDVHVLVHGKTVLTDRTLYDVSHWSVGSQDTVRTTVTEFHDGLHRITGDFRPYSIDRIFGRLDGGLQTVRYGWGDNYQFDLDRSRGLVYAVERVNGGDKVYDHTFKLR